MFAVFNRAIGLPLELHPLAQLLYDGGDAAILHAWSESCPQN
jgi:hypothetical protein